MIKFLARNRTTATESLGTSYTTTPIITRSSRPPAAASTYRKPVSPSARDSTYTAKAASPQRDSVYRSISSSRQYTKSTTPTINTSPSILNSTYKSSNFNPSTVYSHHKTPASTADYRHSMYLDYMTDDGMYDYTTPSSNAQNYLDDGEYYCPNHHHYQYYSRIF